MQVLRNVKAFKHSGPIEVKEEEKEGVRREENSTLCGTVAQ